MIDHVVVLALENRSFDHMLGALVHPASEFDGIGTADAYANPGWDGAPAVVARPGAKPVLPVGPEHAHDHVMAQLGIATPRPPWRPDNLGFVIDFERVGRRIPLGDRYSGLLAPVVNWFSRRGATSEPVIAGRGPLVMLSQSATNVPVLSRLATEFAVCTRWFSSVPGETWPNRNFLHAASSDAEVDIDPRFYENRTIFELLEENGRSWRIYHDDTPQVWAFNRLWDTAERHANWFPSTEFARHAAAGDLPAYSFIEPNHRPPLHTLDHAPVVGAPDVSNNQHPENNQVSNDAYDSFQAGDTDFTRGESLIAAVYEALRGNPELFARTILLVTYDEHGGFYDHVPPPTGVPNPHPSPALLTRLLHLFAHRRSAAFDFTMLGVRVPTVVVSPLIPQATVDTGVRDHASVPSTLRALFAPGAQPLTSRDAWAPPFHGLATLGAPRMDLPDLSAFVRPAVGGAPAAGPAPPVAVPADGAVIPSYYGSFVDLAERVHEHLSGVGEPEAATPMPGHAAQVGATVSQLFADAAARHRAQRAGHDS